MRALITSDLHLTSRSKDAYRWLIFPWLKKTVKRRDIDAIIIAGDLTDQKDRHPATLLNRLLEELAALDTWVYAIMGNHDYIDPSGPYLLQAMNALPKCEFYHKPSFGGFGNVAFLPHTDHHREWFKHKEIIARCPLVIMHATFKGAETSSGYEMEEGLDGRRRFWRNLGLADGAQVVSGDIHVPQKLGRVTYCGAPYPVHFGDEWKPRVILWDSDTGGLSSLRRSTIRKATCRISSPEELDDAGLREGDMAKVILSLKRHRFGEWQELRDAVVAWAREAGVELHGVELKEIKSRARARLDDEGADPTDLLAVFDEYCKTKKVRGDLKKAGRFLLTESLA